MASSVELGASRIVEPSPAVAPSRTASGGSTLRRVLDGGSRFVFLVVIPLLLATAWMRYFVPTPAEAEGTWAASLAAFGHAYPVFLWIGLFLVFSAVARHWSGTLLDSPRARTARARLGTAFAIGVTAAAALLLRSHFGSYRVLSASMLPTLEPEDVVAGRRIAAALSADASSMLRRGDIVVFQKPAQLEGPDELVKRVIGLPGDRITMNGGHPVINGWEVPSCDAGSYLYPLPDGGGVVGRLYVEFLDGRAHLMIHAVIGPEWTGSYDVRPGEVFVLGDNRNNSSDSRAWNDGKGAGLPRASVEARVDRWLFGLRRDDHVDVARLFHPLELFVRLDGMDSNLLRDGIAECLKKPPAVTSPPRAPRPGSEGVAP